MARTKQTARFTTGGKAPRKGVAQTGARKTLGSQGAKRHRKIVTRNVQNTVDPGDIEEVEVFEPIPEISYDVSYESSFYLHYFPSSSFCKKIDEDGVFVPSFSVYETSTDFSEPEALQSATDYWFGMNFTSKYDGNGLSLEKRPGLNLSIVLDISGSMGSPFQSGTKSKIAVAKECILSLTKQLRGDDYLSVVVFNTEAMVIQPLSAWKDIDDIAFSKTISKLKANGGTKLSKALAKGEEVIRGSPEGDNRYSRICILTDMIAQENQDEKSFITNVKQFSTESVYTTIVGVGMDLTKTTVTESSKTPGCNYCNVRSDDDFRNLMDTEFAYLVTPIAFNVKVEIGGSCKVSKGFGSPEISDIPLTNIAFSSIFPSSTDGKGLRSGCYLFKLDPLSTTKELEPLSIKVSWEDCYGICHSIQQNVPFSGDAFDSQRSFDALKPDVIGTRKAVLLVRYTDFVQNIVTQYNNFISNLNDDLPAPKKRKTNSSTEPGNVSQPDIKHIQQFIEHMESEKEILKDNSLTAEIDILKQILILVESLPSNSSTNTQ